MTRSNSTSTNTLPDAHPPVWDAVLEAIFVSPGHDYWTPQGEGRLQHGIRSVDRVECVAGRGLMGDRYFDGRKGHRGQVTFFGAEAVDEIRQRFRLPKLPASVFRRNLIVRGVDLSHWEGKKFEFQGVHFEGTAECKPCIWMDRVVAEGAMRFMQQQFRGGLRAKVCCDGELNVR